MLCKKVLTSFAVMLNLFGAGSDGRWCMSMCFAVIAMNAAAARCLCVGDDDISACCI